MLLGVVSLAPVLAVIGLAALNSGLKGSHLCRLSCTLLACCLVLRSRDAHILASILTILHSHSKGWTDVQQLPGVSVRAKVMLPLQLSTCRYASTGSKLKSLVWQLLQHLDVYNFVAIDAAVHALMCSTATITAMCTVKPD